MANTVIDWEEEIGLTEATRCGLTGQHSCLTGQHGGLTGQHGGLTGQHGGLTGRGLTGPTRPGYTGRQGWLDWLAGLMEKAKVPNIRPPIYLISCFYVCGLGLLSCFSTSVVCD